MFGRRVVLFIAAKHFYKTNPFRSLCAFFYRRWMGAGWFLGKKVKISRNRRGCLPISILVVGVCECNVSWSGILSSWPTKKKKLCVAWCVATLPMHRYIVHSCQCAQHRHNPLENELSNHNRVRGTYTGRRNGQSIWWIIVCSQAARENPHLHTTLFTFHMEARARACVSFYYYWPCIFYMKIYFSFSEGNRLCRGLRKKRTGDDDDDEEEPMKHTRKWMNEQRASESPTTTEMK